VVAPRLLANAAATYPAQALGEHFTEAVQVVLILEIDTEGRVGSAVPTERHDHGFDEAAIAAAQRLAFAPATRDGVPVAAKIRFSYAFTPPPPHLVGRVARRATDSPIAGALVVVRDARGVEHRATTDAAGAWSVGGLQPGKIHVHVAAQGEQPAEVDEVLELAQETNVILRLAPLASDNGAGGPAAGASAEPIEEVAVKGERPPREVTKRTLQRDEIEHVPGTNGDALRSLQNLPGVARPPPYSGALIVRGSAPQDTNIYVDGTNVPLVYHFGGLSSVVPTEILDRIDFYPGGYSAAYGRGMGGVVDVGIRAPQEDGYHGLAQADLIDTRLLVEGPIAAGWSFLAAGRRSWIDIWLGPVLKSAGASVTAAPVYYDYQLELHKDIDSHSSFRALLFGSDDRIALLNQTPSTSNLSLGGSIGYHTSFWRVQLRYDSRLSGSTELRATAAYGEDSVDLGFGTNLANATIHPLSWRAEISQKVVRGLVANAGIDMGYSPYDLTLQAPAPARPGAPSGGPGQPPVHSNASSFQFLPGAYAELEVVPWGGGRVVPGVRADYDTTTADWNIAPRINLRQDLQPEFPRTTLKAGAGVFYQPPTATETDPHFGHTGLSANRSLHYEIGLEQELARHVDLSVDAFYKSFDHLVVPNLGNTGDGVAYGTEWLLRYKPDEHFFGWISYTLSRSERRDSPSEPYALFQYDQTHVLTILGSYKLGRGWQIGARFRLTSGDLYTPTSYGAYDATAGAAVGVAAFPPYGVRLPLFHQLDLRVDKTWTIGRFRLTAYVDVQNVYNAGNPLGVTYNYNYTQSATINDLPILPSLGIRGEL
jgi:TonB family protein